MLGLHVQGAVVVVEVQVSINIAEVTLEDALTKLKRSHLELLDVILGDLKFNGAPSKALAQLKRLELLAKDRPSNFYVHPENFREATDTALSTQKAAFASLGDPDSWHYDRIRLDTDEDRVRLAKRMRQAAKYSASAGEIDAAVRLLEMAHEHSSHADASYAHDGVNDCLLYTSPSPRDS